MSERHSASRMGRSSAVGMRSVAGVSLSKRNVAFDSKLDAKEKPRKATVQVLDDSGEDVTPRSLLPPDINNSGTASKNQSKTVINFNDSASVGTPSELFNQSMFGASTIQASYAAGFSKSIMSSMMGSSRASLDSVTDEISEPSHAHSFTGGIQDIERTHTEVKEELSSSDLKKMVTIHLDETDTIWHFDMPGCTIMASSDDANEVLENNAKYEQLCKNRAGNDMYIQRGMQTFNLALKTKEMQTLPVESKDIGVMATNWDMYDTYNDIKEKAVDEENDEDDMFTASAMKKNAESSKTSVHDQTLLNPLKSQSKSYAAESCASFISSSSVASVMPLDDDDVEVQSEQSSLALSEISSQLAKVMKSDRMKESLFLMERSIVQNLYHPKQCAYRGLPDLNFMPLPPDDDTKEEPSEESTRLGPNLSRLWSYECQETKAMVVNCIVWNKQNHDVVAVGYGENGSKADGRGLACVWCIKNPEHPERLFTLPGAVTSMDFSSSHPNFLAVGLYNGAIIVYNIRSTGNSYVLDSMDSVGKHSSPIWQLKWIERDKGTGEEKGEVLVSTGADGRITQWSIRKGFEYLDLMKLKRQHSSKQVAKKKNETSSTSSKKSDALISRYAAGLCFDFHPTDGNIYIVGTEEGFIHRCSCSYNEQFMETYTGHKNSVYRCYWSPFDHDMFLTCSSDWTIRLWHSEKTKPLLTLQSSTKSIIDIDWSPKSSVMFAAINESQIELWDLSVSTLDPLLISVPVNKVELTSVKFALNSNALLIGDAAGHVTIYQMREINFDNVESKNKGWLSRVLNSSLIPVPEDDKSDVVRKNGDEDNPER